MSNSSEEKKEQETKNNTATPETGPESSQDSVKETAPPPVAGQTGPLPERPTEPESVPPATAQPPAAESTAEKAVPPPTVEGGPQEAEQPSNSDRITQTQEAAGPRPARRLKRRATRQQLSKPDTAVLASTRLRRSSKGSISQGTVSFGEQRELILVIRGIVERIILPEDQSIVLGRSDARLRYHADVDLTPYGALDRGVSREHARVYTEGGHLYIVDMNSTNGTFLAGKRLDPNAPTLLRKGDELLLGRLPVQILFR